jgi:hypothetical protein
MTCPHCFTALEPGSTLCPQCGIRVLRNVSAVMRTSAVWISTGDSAKFYGSLREVPEALRKRLVECTNSTNSGTIVIADRGGRDRLVAGAQSPANQADARKSPRKRYARIPNFGRTPPRNPPSYIQPELPVIEPPVAQPANQPEEEAHWLAWAGLIVVLGSAAVIAAAFGFHW